MKPGMFQNQQLRQEMKLAPRMMQALRFLQAPLPELQHGRDVLFVAPGDVVLVLPPGFEERVTPKRPPSSGEPGAPPSR